MAGPATAEEAAGVFPIVILWVDNGLFLKPACDTHGDFG